MTDHSIDNHDDHQTLLQTFIFPCAAFIIGLILDEVNKRLKFLGLPDSIVQFVFAMCCSFMLNKFLAVDITNKIDKIYTWITLDPQTVLLLMLPPLIFDSALRINSHLFYAKLKMLISLTVFIYIGTLMISSALMIPLLMSTQNLCISAVFLFVCIIVATDPVAVLAMLEQYGAPHRLRLMIEGESLLNDGLALTLYRIILEMFKFETVNHSIQLMPQLFSMLTCFVLSPILGIVSASLLTRILGKIVETKKKQALILSCVFIMFITCDKLNGSPALGIMFFGVTLNYNKEVMSPETSQVAIEVWQSLGYWANNVIFSYAGYLIGKEIFTVSGNPQPKSYAKIASNDIYTLIQGVIISPIPLLGRIISTYLYYKIYPCFKDDRPSKTDFVLLAYSGLRGALGLLLAMELTKEVDVGDLDDTKVILLLTCSTTVTCLVFQGVTYRLIVAREGTTKRSRYVMETCSRINNHIEKEFFKKLHNMKRKNCAHHIGTNWVVAEKEILNCFKRIEKKNLMHERDSDSNSWLDSVVADAIQMKQVDAMNAKTALYGKLLARAYDYWQQGAVSGKTMHILTAVLEHGIDEGDIIPSHIEDQLSIMEPSLFTKWISGVVEVLYRCLERYSCTEFLRFCTIGKHRLFSEMKPIERIKNRKIEIWWILHTFIICGFTVMILWTYYITPIPSAAIYLANFWILWITSLVEMIYIVHQSYKNKRYGSYYLGIVPASIVPILMSIAFISVFLMIDGGKCVNNDIQQDLFCSIVFNIFIGSLVTCSAFRLIRAIPLTIITLRESQVKRKLTYDRVRMAVLHFFNIMLKETHISPDLYSEEAYRTVTREIEKLTSIINSFVRLYFKENNDGFSVIPVIKTRQTVRMMSFTLKSLLNDMKIEGYFPPEVEETWTNVVSHMREKVDDLLVVPESHLKENLEVIEWIRQLSEKNRKDVIDFILAILSYAQTTVCRSQQTIKTYGNKMFYIQKGMVKVSEWLPTRSSKLHEFYISQGNFIGERNILLQGMDKSNLFPFMFPKRRYETTTECELVEINSQTLFDLLNIDETIAQSVAQVIQLGGLSNEIRHFNVSVTTKDKDIDNETSFILACSQIIEEPKNIEIQNGHIAIIGCWTELTAISNENSLTKDCYIKGPCIIGVKPVDDKTTGLVLIQKLNGQTFDILEEYSNISLRHAKGRKKKLVIARSTASKFQHTSTSLETTRSAQSIKHNKI